jgi:endo-1,4-beta-xylanase
LLIRSFGIEEGNANATGFADVKAGAWHSGYITAAQSLGIISGQGNGQFGPNEEISRQDMVVMIYNTIQAVGVNLHSREGLTEFKDEAAVSGYAVEAIQSMQQAGIIKGSADGHFMPHNQATRAEAAVIIYNLIQAMK